MDNIDIKIGIADIINIKYYIKRRKQVLKNVGNIQNNINFIDSVLD